MTEHKHSQREPLVRLAKREDLSRGKKWAIRLGAILLALAVGSLFILVLGQNPWRSTRRSSPALWADPPPGG